MPASPPGLASPVTTGRHAGIRYMPGVDGLRALAVVAVVVYHLGAAWLPGGYLGVDVFLVISGFLITSLLLAEHRRTGRIDLVRFWLRRAGRLLPAVITMIVVVLLVMLVLHTGEVARVRGQAVAALAYVSNWYFIVVDVPYFERFGRPSVYLHLWSLAIEEQFYLVWPVVLAGVLMLVRWSRAVLGVLVVAAAIGSSVLAWVLWQPYSDPSRIYYGTDTRAVALLAGVGLALLPAAARGGDPRRRRVRRAVQVIGVGGLVVVLGAMAFLGDLDERLYRGGFALVAVASALLVAAAADSGMPMARLFGWRPLVWLGLRSYALYLWHWPVIALTRPHEDVPLDGLPLLLVRLVLMFALTELSYRLVEVPFRRAGLRGVREGLRAWDGRIGRPLGIAAVSGALAAMLALVGAVALVPPGTTAIPGLTADAHGATASARGVPDAADPADTSPPLFVGDSVMLGARDGLVRTFGRRSVIDAQAGRTFPEGAALVRAHLRRMPADSPVVVHLGNNSFVRPADLDALLTNLAARPRVFLVSVRVPLPWQDSVNETLRGAVARFPNVRLIDWYTASDRPGLLVDGAHMNARGVDVYTHTLTEALAAGGSIGDRPGESDSRRTG